MDTHETAILIALDRAMGLASARSALDAIARSVEDALEAAPAEPLAWAPVPLSTYDALPDCVKSSWVFVLRAKTETGAERHSNSRQRMASYRGYGDFQTRTTGNWVPHKMASDPDAPLESRWISIPEGVWHQGKVGPSNWVVVSFHTVPEHELEEERPGEKGEEKKRKYAPGKGRE